MPAESGQVITGTTKTTGTSTTGGVTTTTTGTADSYQTEFVRVYQDAGVVGVAMLTLLVLCLLLGMFCTRLIRMYTTLTSSRDAVEAARSQAIEKLTMSVVLMRSENTAGLAEYRRQGDERAEQIKSLVRSVEQYEARTDKAYTLLVEVHTLLSQLSKSNQEEQEAKLRRIEALLAQHSGPAVSQGA